MYAPPAFETDRAVALAFAAARGFGLVIASDGGRPVASLLPFHVSEANGGLPRVQFHVARGNPFVDLAAKGGTWLIAVAGADTYVSPDWYVSPDQVPTWLYETVQLSGPVHIVPPDHTPAHLERAYAQGLRAIGPAHYGPGTYAQGTHATGGQTRAGPSASSRTSCRRLVTLVNTTVVDVAPVVAELFRLAPVLVAGDV